MKDQRIYRVDLEMLPQPNATTCGPTCLHAVYNYFDDPIELEQVVNEVHTFEDGGTLAVWLGCHALQRGYEAIVYTYNLQVFDPTWFHTNIPVDLREKLQKQLEHKRDEKFVRTSKAFMDFIKLGGKLRQEEPSKELFRKYLNQKVPILTGLSSTFLYTSAREIPQTNESDDIQGEPTGHFVVLCGYNRDTKTISVADPLGTNPYSESRKYEVPIYRVICSILLGVLTYDANFLIIRPKINSQR